MLLILAMLPKKKPHLIRRCSPFDKEPLTHLNDICFFPQQHPTKPGTKNRDLVGQTVKDAPDVGSALGLLTPALPKSSVFTQQTPSLELPTVAVSASPAGADRFWL